MKQTYDEALTQVFKDEGGYSNDAGDPGGPTKYGITIIDARLYWKKDATAGDVRQMPKSVATDIYRKHYANPIRYDDLPAGIDYAVLDYGINSGISRGVKVLQRIVGVKADGIMGTNTLIATRAKDPVTVINAIYDERLKFLKGLKTWPTFGKGWQNRVDSGRKLALQLVAKYKDVKPPVVTEPHAPTVMVASGGAMATAMLAIQHWPHWHFVAFGTAAAVALTFIGVELYKHNKGTANVV